MKSKTKRMVAIALIVVACALISELIVSQPVLNKGVVIGMGVDQTEQGNVEVTIQIAVAGESSAPGAPNRYAVVSGEDKTLIGAMEKISRIIAYKPAYFHCHILVLGEKLITEGVKDVVMQARRRRPCNAAYPCKERLPFTCNSSTRSTARRADTRAPL